MEKLSQQLLGWVVVLLLGTVLSGCAEMTADADPEMRAESPIVVQVSTPLPTPDESGNLLVSDASAATLPSQTPTRRPTHTPIVTATASATPTDTPIPTDTPLPADTPTSIPTSITNPTPIADHLHWRVPILMYHYLSAPPPGADAIRRDLSVSPAQFEAQLAYLQEVGYTTISLNDLARAASGEIGLPPKPIILTFDDGHRDNYEHAFPLLQQYGYTATFFIFTQPIDTYNVDYLTWEMVIEMHQAGMEFGSHSYRHLDMTNRDVDFLIYEIVGSKEAIEARLDEPVHFFAYPAGRYDQLTIDVLKSANFWGAVTTHWGIDQSFDDRYEMRRLRMRGNDTVQDLINKLEAF